MLDEGEAGAGDEMAEQAIAQGAGGAQQVAVELARAGEAAQGVVEGVGPRVARGEHLRRGGQAGMVAGEAGALGSPEKPSERCRRKRKLS